MSVGRQCHHCNTRKTIISGNKLEVAITVYGADWCGDCRRAKAFLDAHGIAYTEIDIDRDPAAEAELLARVGKRAVPQMVIDGEWFQPYRTGAGLLLDELHRRLGLPKP